MKEHKTVRETFVFTSIMLVIMHFILFLVGTRTAEIISWFFSSLYTLFFLGILLYLYISGKVSIQKIHVFEKEKSLPSILDEYEKKEGYLTEFDIKFILHRLFPDSQLSYQIIKEILDLWTNE